MLPQILEDASRFHWFSIKFLFLDAVWKGLTWWSINGINWKCLAEWKPILVIIFYRFWCSFGAIFLFAPIKLNHLENYPARRHPPKVSNSHFTRSQSIRPQAYCRLLIFMPSSARKGKEIKHRLRFNDMLLIKECHCARSVNLSCQLSFPNAEKRLKLLILQIRRASEF